MKTHSGGFCCLLLPFLCSALLLLTGCHSQPDQTALQAQIDRLEAENQMLRQQLQDLQNQPDGKEPFSSPLGAVVRISDNVRLECTDWYYSRVLAPSQPATGTYTQYKADRNETFLILHFKVKNLSAQQRTLDSFFRLSLLYDGAYEYAFSCVSPQNDNAGFRNASTLPVEPLTTEELICFAPIPSVASTNRKSLELTLFCAGETYTYRFK